MLSCLKQHSEIRLAFQLCQFCFQAATLQPRHGKSQCLKQPSPWCCIAVTVKTVKTRLLDFGVISYHFIIFYLKQLISRCCNFHVSVFSFWLRCKPRPDLLIGNKMLFFRVSRLVLFYGVYGRGFDRDLVKSISSCATLSSSGKWLHREYARQPSWHCFLKWSTLQSTSLLISDKSDKSGHHLMQFDGSRWTLTWVVPWKWWNHVGRSPRSLWSHGWLCIQVKITGLSWPLRWKWDSDDWWGNAFDFAKPWYFSCLEWNTCDLRNETKK